MSKKISGSIRKCTVEGVAFDVAADANLTHVFTIYENSMVPTSGNGMRKMTKRIPSIEGLVLVCDANERLVLKDFAEGLDDVKVTVTLASGDSYRCEGTVEIENNESEENRTSCAIHPRGDWTKF